MCEQKIHVIKHISVKLQHSKREGKSEGKIWQYPGSKFNGWLAVGQKQKNHQT